MSRNSSPRLSNILPARRAAAALSFVCLLGAAACAASRTYQVESLWPKNPVLIDGKSDDWRGALAFVGEGELSLGFYNDGDNLYLCLLVADEMSRERIIRSGLMVWIDPQGGKARTLGIRYPAGPPAGGPPEESETEPTDRRSGRERPPDREMGPPSEGALDEIEIIRSGKNEPERIKLDQVHGLEVKMEEASGLLVYELKIPLLGDGQSTVSIGAKPGATVGIGLETAEFKRRGRDMMGPGGMPRGGGGMSPMGGRGRFGGRMPANFDFPKPLKIWAFVKLSSGAGAPSAALMSLENLD